MGYNNNMATKQEKKGVNGKKEAINFAVLAGLFAFRYKDVLIHKALWMLFKKALPYLLISLVLLVGLVALLTFVFVRIFTV